MRETMNDPKASYIEKNKPKKENVHVLFILYMYIYSVIIHRLFIDLSI